MLNALISPLTEFAGPSQSAESSQTAGSSQAAYANQSISAGAALFALQVEAFRTRAIECTFSPIDPVLRLHTGTDDTFCKKA